jgi:hypothetical protein
MSKSWNPKRPTVELQPSKIRREPPPETRTAKLTVLPEDESDREAWTVVIGVVLFALAITLIIFCVSSYTSSNPAAEVVIHDV